MSDFYRGVLRCMCFLIVGAFFLGVIAAAIAGSMPALAVLVGSVLGAAVIGIIGL